MSDCLCKESVDSKLVCMKLKNKEYFPIFTIINEPSPNG